MYNLLFTLMMLPDSLASRYANRAKNRGQGSLEYVGMIAVAAIIIVAVAVVAKTEGPNIGKFITAAIAKVQGAIA